MKTIITQLFFVLALCFSLNANAQPANCQASFMYVPDSTGYGIQFTNTSTGNFTNVTWSFGDGTSSSQANPLHYYNTTGTVIVCLSITDFLGTCQSTTCDTITIGNPMGGCSASFSWQTSGSTVYFYGYGATSAVSSYTWDFGDGNVGTGQFPSNQYNQPGNYNVCLTVTYANGCVATYCSSVAVQSGTGCQAYFSWSPTGASNLTVGFTNLSSGSSLSYSWSFGDNTTSVLQNPSHTYSQQGTYYVCLTISNAIGCSSTYCDSVIVGNNTLACNALFGYQNVGNTYSFNTNPLANGNHYWSFGDGTFSFSANPTHTYGAAGTYQVCHTVTDSLQSCTNTYCTTITISSGGNCNASFSYATDTSGYIYIFLNTSLGTGLASYWSFGDGTGSTQTSPTHTYTSPGVYVVCLSLSASNGTILCSYCDSIVVGNPVNPCTPVFYSYPDSNVIGNGSVNFGIYNPCGGTQYVWDFGDGTVGSGSNPSHVYADSGWYYVCVTGFTPSGTYTFCDSVFALRIGGTTAVTEFAKDWSVSAYPNPVAGFLNVSLRTSFSGNIIIRLVNTAGIESAVLLNENMAEGTHGLSFDTRPFASGIYLLQIIGDNTILSRRISIIK